MVKKTISQQTDGKDIKSDSALEVFEQGGDTFKKIAIPDILHVRSLVHLNNVLPGKIIADNRQLTLIFDEDFALDTTGFKMGEEATLEIQHARIDVEIDTSAVVGPLFELLDVVKPCQSLIIEDGIRFVGNPTTPQPFCKLEGTLRFFMLNPVTINYDGADVDFPFIRFTEFPPVNWSKGWIFRNTDIAQITSTNLRQLSAKTMTFLSFILPNSADIVISNGTRSTLFAEDSFIYIDKNAPPGTRATINGNKITAGDFYQLGSDLAISAVEDDGNGKLRLESLAHGLTKDQVMVLSGFSESTYNKTAFVKVFDLNRLDVEEITFVPGADSGNVNGASLDSTDNKIQASNNSNQQNSMSLAEGRSMNPIAFASVIGTFVPIQNTVPVAGDFIEDSATESFTVDDETGIITYTGLEPITATIAFDFLLSKVGGGTDNAVVSLFDLTTQLSKTDQIVVLSSTVQKIDYNGGIFQIAPGDNFQLKIDNDAVSTINVSALKILITRQ